MDQTPLGPPCAVLGFVARIDVVVAEVACGKETDLLVNRYFAIVKM